jgi:hypothetical protein
MIKFMILGASLLAIGNPAQAAQGSASASAASGKSTCDAKYYGYLVGKGLDEARSVEGSNYRMLTQGSARGEADPKRMTIVYDAKSNQIVEVGCG